jgi:hypothetical protein
MVIDRSLADRKQILEVHWKDGKFGCMQVNEVGQYFRNTAGNMKFSLETAMLMF